MCVWCVFLYFCVSLVLSWCPARSILFSMHARIGSSTHNPEQDYWYRKWIDGLISCIHFTLGKELWYDFKFDAVAFIYSLIICTCLFILKVAGYIQVSSGWNTEKHPEQLASLGIKKKKTSNCNLSHYTQLSLTSYKEYIFVSGESVSLPVWERRQKREIIMCLNNTSLVFSSIFLSSLLTDTLWRWRVHHQTGGQRRHLLHHQ